MSAGSAPPQEEKLNDLISDLINAYSGQTEPLKSSAEQVGRTDEASSSSRRSEERDEKAASAGKRATKEETGSGSSLTRNDSKTTTSTSMSTSKASATPETGKKNDHTEHRSHRHRDKDREKDREKDKEKRDDRDKERDKKDEKEREREKDGEGKRTHKHRHREGSKREARDGGKSDGAKEGAKDGGEDAAAGTTKEEEAEKEEERVIPPVCADFKKSWNDLPEDVQRKIEKLRLPSELQIKYFKHLYTICRFLLKSSFPDTAAAADKEPEKKEDIVVVKDGKGDSPSPSPALARGEEKSKRRTGGTRPTKVRNRAYATEAQMARAKQIVINAQKPMKKLYKSAEKSGQGGFGTVMVAKDVNAKQRVAIKKLPHSTPRMQENNWSEIAFLSMCKHPNIVQFQKAFIVKEKDQPEEVWIVTEFLEGGTLSEAARAHRFSDQHIAYVAHEILVALKYLHSLKLVHRDLKSANVMMSIKGEIKLIDFGLCADFSEGPRVKMLGSPYWIPPEMVWEMPHSYSADIWSMAVCILELYLANPPYPASSIKCMFMACTVGLADQIPEKATPEARDFLTRCFTLDPEQRPLPDALLTHPWVSRPNLSHGIIDVLKQVFLTNSLESLGF